MDHTLGQNLRDINKELKKWNKEVCGELKREINFPVDHVATLDLERKKVWSYQRKSWRSNDQVLSCMDSPLKPR